MPNIDDLLASTKTVAERYSQGSMERETVREWVLRLGSYPAPHGDRVREAAEWFRLNPRSDVPPEVRQQDIEKLKAIRSGC